MENFGEIISKTRDFREIFDIISYNYNNKLGYFNTILFTIFDSLISFLCII